MWFLFPSWPLFRDGCKIVWLRWKNKGQPLWWRRRAASGRTLLFKLIYLSPYIIVSHETWLFSSTNPKQKKEKINDKMCTIWFFSVAESAEMILRQTLILSDRRDCIVVGQVSSPRWYKYGIPECTIDGTKKRGKNYRVTFFSWDNSVIIIVQSFVVQYEKEREREIMIVEMHRDVIPLFVVWDHGRSRDIQEIFL